MLRSVIPRRSSPWAAVVIALTVCGASRDAVAGPDADTDAADAPAEATLTGRVLERGSGVPLAATLRAGEMRARADASGHFSIPVPPGPGAIVEIATVDHQPLRYLPNAQPGETIEVVLRLDRVSWTDEVIVHGERQAEEVLRRSFSADELRRVPGSFGDPIRALQSLPGVARPTAVEGALVVRGADAWTTAAFLDEVPIPYLFHFFLGRSVVPPTLLDRVDFYPGGMPSRFGNSLQSVVHARFDVDPPKPGLHGRASVDLLDSAIALEGRVGRWTLRGSARLATIGALIGLTSRLIGVSQGFSWRETPYLSPTYFDVLARADADLEIGRLSLLLIGVGDAFVLRPARRIDGGVLEPDPILDLPHKPYRLIDSGFWRFQARFDGGKGAHTHRSWLIGGVQREKNVLGGFGPLIEGPVFGEVAGAVVHGFHDQRLQLSDTWELRYGGEVEVTPQRARSFLGITRPDDPIPTEHDVAVRAGPWFEAQHRIGEVWFAPGLRLGIHHFNGQTTVAPEPRLGVRYGITNKTRLSAFMGATSQRPPMERYGALLGTGDLPLARAWQASIGAETQLRQGVTLDATLFGSRFFGVSARDWQVQIVEDPRGSVRGSPVGGAELVPVFLPAEGWAGGVEAMIRVQPTRRFFGWAALTLSRSVRRVQDRWVPSDYDQPINLALVAAYKLPKQWEISGRVRLGSGAVFTPFSEVYDPWTPRWRGLAGDVNGGRLPFFGQFDLRIQKTWTRERSRPTLYLDVFNTLNNRNPLAATYLPNYADLVPLLSIPIVPVLGVEVAF